MNNDHLFFPIHNMDTEQGQSARKRKRPNNFSEGEPCVPLEFKWPVSMCFVDCMWLSLFKLHINLLHSYILRKMTQDSN